MPEKRPAPRRQAGSAYIVALLVLVLLTLLGLTLSLITQSEMQVGANERVVQRTFFAADSGTKAATAQALVLGDQVATVFDLPDPDSPPALGLRSQISLAPFVPVLAAPCNLCDAANAGEYGVKTYKQIHYGATSLANRHALAGGDSLAAKTVSAMVLMQPRDDTPEPYLALESGSIVLLKF